MSTFQRFTGQMPAAGSLIIRFYHSGGEVRGYIRRVEPDGADDTVFPGEEMEPDVALRMAENKNRPPDGRSDLPILIELSEGVQWNPAWGHLAGA
ncbi:hypothetical protein [Rhizobium sp. SSA_523]|uniref:hypothetical protein n=1 Tax=Rhizobium sp. SSA_523 TaxID=2952477 RepID=UPI0020910276|nr:hypothetical protein [Rhizobium sp. SSA_523]MCO5733795.1 hypothetical protein [Rhizobium sp. SSA_523]WKC24930.1 hypothetical protein QTJ18_13055 [Rhizobium sp. SSA_523]